VVWAVACGRFGGLEGGGGMVVAALFR